MSTNAITIANTLPAELVALSGETLEKLDALLERSHGYAEITDLQTWEQADACYREMTTFASAVEKQRKALKSPVLELGRAIDAAADAALAPLADQRSVLGPKVNAFKEAENRRRQEEQRKAQEEARRIEQERIAAVEAERKRLEDAAAFDAAYAGKAADPVPVFTAPEVQPVRPAYVPPPLKGSTKSRTDYDLVIEDIAKIPAEIHGVRLLVPDEKAIRQLLKAGLKVPGCAWVERVGVAAKGGA